MERRNYARWDPFRPKQNRVDSGGLCRPRKLAEQRQSLFRQKLQHLQLVAKTLGTVLGRQCRRKHFLLWRLERRRDGLLDRRTAAARRLQAQTSSAIFRAWA